MTHSIILASTSPYRRAQLEQLGLSFEVFAPRVNENAYKARLREPDELALALALAKAKAVAKVHPEALVIGGDQVVESDGALLDKPGDGDGAVRQLKRLAGKTHRLWSAVAVCQGEDIEVAEVSCLTMKMRKLTDAEIRRYVERDKPWDCVGSYRLEALGISLFSAIEGDDHTAIIGLPLMRLVTMLKREGVQIP